MTESLYIMDPQEFLERNLSMGHIGDIRRMPLDEARAGLAVIARNRGLGRASIALLAFREEGIPGTSFLPVHGLIYPIFPSPDPEAEWQCFRDDFTHIVKAPGQLHAYDGDSVALPI